MVGSDVYAVQTHAGKVISTHSANLISLFDPLFWFALVKSLPVYRDPPTDGIPWLAEKFRPASDPVQ